MRWLLALAVVGCAPAYTTFVRYDPVTRTAPAEVNDADLYSSAMWVLIATTYVATGDAPSKIIVTPFEPVGVPAPAETMTAEMYNAGTVRPDSMRFHRWRVRVAERLLEIAIDCGEVKLADGRPTLGCPTEDRAEDWVRAAQGIADSILSDASRRAARRPKSLE